MRFNLNEPYSLLAYFDRVYFVYRKQLRRQLELLWFPKCKTKRDNGYIWIKKPMAHLQPCCWARIIFGAMVMFAIIFQFLAYLAGQLDLKASLARLFLATILLNGYESTDNFRYTIRNSAERIGVWIRDGSDLKLYLQTSGKFSAEQLAQTKVKAGFPEFGMRWKPPRNCF